MTLGGVTSRTSLKCLPPLDSPERIFGGISSSQSSARTPMRRAATLEKTWKMSNRNGRIRSIISSYTRRMSLALLALIWIEPFLALTLTPLQHFRQLKTQKLYMHVDGRPRKVRTVSRGEPCLMYETRLSRMIMQLPPAQMANRDGDAGMETMLWDINIIPNELDNGYLMLPPGVLHMSALARFGRFTLFSPRVSHSKHLPVFCFVLCFGFGGVCCFVVFLFPVLQVFGIPNSPRSLDLDDRQGFIASSAMQQKKKHYKVRRLHLVIVDLWRPWKIHKTQVRSLTDQLRRLQPGPHSDYTTPLAPIGGKTPLHGRRFVYGYSLDGSDFPCYLVWPWRTEDNSFFLLESQTHRYVALDKAGFLHPLGLRHFYDGFSLRAEISIRSAALVAFDLQEDELSSDLILSQAAVVARGWADHQEQPVDQNAPEADRRNVPEEIISVSDSEVDRESTIGGCSSQASCSTTSSDDASDTSEPAMSEVSVQHSMLEHAYQSIQNAFSANNGQLVGGDGTLNQLELLPFHWPLAKLTLPLKFGVNRLDGLVVGFLMELMATKSEPWRYRRQVSSFAKTLTVRVATYLAKEIA